MDTVWIFFWRKIRYGYSVFHVFSLLTPEYDVLCRWGVCDDIVTSETAPLRPPVQKMYKSLVTMIGTVHTCKYLARLAYQDINGGVGELAAHTRTYCNSTGIYEYIMVFKK